MEVHKHPHHVTHKKKWTEYLLEFFMIFFAVFLGFIAENIREHTVDRKKEKEYMHAMVEDLKKDTAMLTRVIKRTTLITDRLDTMSRIILFDELNDSAIRKIYRINLGSHSNIITTFTDRTASQLKTGGGLHLIKSPAVVSNLFDYWTKADQINTISLGVNELRFLAREKSYSIFSARYYISRPAGDPVTAEKPELMTTESSVLTEYANILSHIKNGNQNVYLPFLKEEFDTAVKLIELITKEYHLENE